MSQSKTALLDRFAARAEDRPLLGRLLDLSDAADRRGTAQASRFLDARQQGLASSLLTAAGRPHALWGGYEGAERRVAVLLPDETSPWQALSRCAPTRPRPGSPTVTTWGR